MQGGQRMNLRGMAPSLIVNAVLPYIAYQVLTGSGVDTAQALTLSAVFPLIGIIWGFVRSRRADIIGVVSLIFIVLGVVTSAISGDPRFILIKESFLTGAFGVACLVSLLMPRPLMFYFGRQFAGGGDPVRTARFEAMWQYPGFRAVNRTMTVVWGIAYVLEALARIGLTFVLPIALFLVVSPVLAFGVTVALISWTVAYGRRAAQRAAQLRQSTSAPAP
jgi:hypothetical protein